MQKTVESVQSESLRELTAEESEETWLKSAWSPQNLLILKCTVKRGRRYFDAAVDSCL